MKIILSSIFSLFAFVSLSAQTIFDFEAEETSANFTYFGSTINGTDASIIANPDASGINTSGNVVEFIKPPASETWAGASTSVDPPIDLTSNSEVCIDVWVSEPGNLALKLESGDLPNWILSLDITETQTWTTLCYNTLLPSIEGGTTAGGGIFSSLALFFDFGTSLTEEKTYYFDNIRYGGSIEAGNVTFSVDMNEYEGDFETVYVSGDFNGFSGNLNPMSDEDGDGVWTTTVQEMEPGTQNYKFQLDQWAAQEMFTGTESCTEFDPSGEFINRVAVITGDTELPTVCFGSCYACGESINITINLGEAGTMVSEDGLFLAGGDDFKNSGSYPLTANGDGTHSITIERGVGYESYYTFLNGTCPDYSCKESIINQDCADPENFNDRFMGPFTEDVVINTCFGVCSDMTECEPVLGPMVTFEVDMNFYEEAFETVFLAGTFNNWSADANPMSDEDGDGIWTTSLTLVDGDYQYKFQLDGWSPGEEFAEVESCTFDDGSGFINRLLTVNEGNANVCFTWNTCAPCGESSINDLELSESIFNIQPTLISAEATLYFNTQINERAEIQIYGALGQLIEVEQVNTQTGQHTINLSHLTNGLYFINVETSTQRQTKRVLVNH